MAFTGFKPLELSDIQRVAPSVFAERPYHDRSDRYGFIPTIQVVQALIKEGFVPVKATQNVVRLEDKRNFTKHMLRFRLAGSSPVVGDVFPEIVVVNSHDGLSAYELLLALWKLACGNGMIANMGDLFSIHVRHSKNIVGEVLEGATELVQSFPKMITSVKNMREIELNRDEQGIFATGAMLLKYGEKDVESDDDFPFNPERLLDVRRWEDRQEQGNLWGTFNIVQENLLKGGQATRSESGRRSRTRQTKSISEDLRLNKALWLLAEEMKKLKS